jgi:predicted metalloprotease
MEWRGRRESENVEDRRGIGGITFIGGGAGLVIILIISLLTGQNPLRLLQQVGGGGTQVAVDGNSPATGAAVATTRFLILCG